MHVDQKTTARTWAGLQSDLLERVGNTPLLPLRKITRTLAPNVDVLAKAEWHNPSGSVKARPALHIVGAAIRSGELERGRRLLDSTSGNMGIAYATFGAALDIGVTLCVPSNVSPERLRVLRALGAEVILTDGLEGSDGAILAARELAARHPERYWYANQYDNPMNWQAHYLSTGPEIEVQTGGGVTHLVAGIGTSGTLVGISRYLRERIPGIQVIAAQPDAAFHGLEGLKHMPTAIRPGIFDEGAADLTLNISTEEAHEMVRRLARDEGLLVGISSGAAMVAAVKVASRLERGVVVTIFPDDGHKYLSESALWEGT